MKRQSENESVASDIEQDILNIRDSLQNKFCYLPKEDKIFQYNVTHWENINITEFEHQVEKIILRSSSKIKSKLNHNNTVAHAKSHATRAKGYLRVEDAWLLFPSGMNFANGYLVFETGEMLPHTHTRWVTKVNPIEYDKSQHISKETQNIILKMLGNDVSKINLLRTAGYRCLFPSPQYQTAYYWSGPPGSGKSTIVNLLLELTAGNSGSCELRDLDNAFTRSEVVDYNLLVVNEISSVEKNSDKYLKELIGRYYLSTEKKNHQGYHSKTFKGVIIMTSNMSHSLVFASSEAMMDRTVEIDFSAREGPANPYLLEGFIKESSGFINWFLTINKEVLYSLVRATSINKEEVYKDNVMVNYILANLTYKKG